MVRESLKRLALYGVLGAVTCHAKLYQKTIDPSHAEDVLAQLAGRPRITENDWLSLLGDKKDQTYTVSQGDNLWAISRKLFGNPYLWRKLWQVNPELSNPHELTSGEILRLYWKNGDRDLASADEVIKIPLMKLVPAKKGKGNDVDGDAIFNIDIKNRFKPAFFILTEDAPIYGEITGTYSEREAIGLHESVYIDPGEKTLKPGDVYTVIHEERSVGDRTKPGAPDIGILVRIVGEVRILEEGEHLMKAEIRSISGIIKRGDKLIGLEKAVSWNTFMDPPNELQTRIVMGEDAEFKMFGQGQLVLLNKGTAEGMKEGFVFRVWRDRDPQTLEESHVEPEAKGEIRVIYVGAASSVGYILRNLEPLRIGDTLIPRQAFTNPLPPPLKNLITREID